MIHLLETNNHFDRTVCSIIRNEDNDSGEKCLLKSEFTWFQNSPLLFLGIQLFFFVKLMLVNFSIFSSSRKCEVTVAHFTHCGRAAKHDAGAMLFFFLPKPFAFLPFLLLFSSLLLKLL